VNRRDFIIGIAGSAAAWPLAVRAQQAAGQPLVGLLSPLSATAAARNVAAFRQGMRDLGYLEGRNVSIAVRYGDGRIAKLPELAGELVALNPAVIVVGSLPATNAVRNATRTIPIVMTHNQDPVALGFAASLARPGGNVTGFWIEGEESLLGKRLALLKTAVPDMLRVGVMVNPEDPSDAGTLAALAAATQALGLVVRVLEMRTAAEFEPAFATAMRESLQGLHVSQGPLFNTSRAEVTALAARTRLPAIYGFREFALAGGLMSYAASLPDIYRRFAGLVDKILKGASAGDLPIERPTKFELVVNLKTAKAMGLTISEPFLLVADEVIE
jgi:putative ABC transport system substrate-binding protein